MNTRTTDIGQRFEITRYKHKATIDRASIISQRTTLIGLYTIGPSDGIGGNAIAIAIPL